MGFQWIENEEVKDDIIKGTIESIKGNKEKISENFFDVWDKGIDILIKEKGKELEKIF